MNAHVFRPLTFLVLWTCVFISHSLAADHNATLTEHASFEILHYEPLPPVTLQSRAQDLSSDPPETPTWNWTFEAFGKTFHARVEPNTRLITRLPKEQRTSITSHYSLYRGKLEGISGSWVRLTNMNGNWSGMIWDSEEIYVIDPMTMMAAALQTTPSDETATHGIYRLSDTKDLEQVSCGLGHPDTPAEPITDYQGLLEELQQIVPSVAEGAYSNLDMAIVADVQFAQEQQSLGIQTDAAVIARMNVVDGIFSEQVGVQISLVEIRELSQNGELSSSNASTLLNQFSNFTASQTFNHPGLAHLFTARELDGSTVGIAFLSSLCNARFGVGVDEIQGGGTARALVVAHEIGHNFGAPHDNQGNSPCAGTPGDFLMNPFINGSDQFSPCSLTQMQPVINGASCVTVIDLTQTDVRITIPTNPSSRPVGLPFDYTLEVQNTGTLTANTVNASIDIPAALTVNSAMVGNEACTTSGSTPITCALGDIPSGQDRTITLNLEGQATGRLTLDAQITAANDQNPQNNSIQGIIDFVSSGPTVEITSPQDGDTLSTESAIAFLGTATDGEDGDLSHSIVWTSDQDGELGTGNNISAMLSAGTHRITASATDQDNNTSMSMITITVIDGEIGTILFESHFDAGPDDFTFRDDAFRSTNQPNFASGSHEPQQGFTGGGLRVQLGGINNADIANMSGGWTRTFTVPIDGNIILTFQYRLTQTSDYERDEFSEALLAVDGQLIGTENNEFLARIVGNGNGGSAQTTGWIPVALPLGTLSTGQHTLTIGGFNNKKTFNNEFTEVLIDDVVVRRTDSTPPPPPTDTIIDASFDGGTDGFSFVNDAFRNTSQPTFSRGTHLANQGFTGGGLQVLVGGINNANILNMSGGWRRSFSLPSTRAVTITLRYRLTQANNYESDEFSEALLTIDGQLLGPSSTQVLSRITGDGNGGPNRGTGWVAVSLNAGTLAQGAHTITIGGFNNKKTFNDESSQILIDDVIVR